MQIRIKTIRHLSQSVVTESELKKILINGYIKKMITYVRNK